MSMSQIDTYANAATSELSYSLAALRLEAAMRDFKATVAAPGGVVLRGSALSRKHETSSALELSQHEIVEQLRKLITACRAPGTSVNSERPEESLYWLGGGASSRQRQIALETLQNIRGRSKLQASVAAYEAQIKTLADNDGGDDGLPFDKASRLAVEARVEAALYNQRARHGRLEMAVQHSEKHLRNAAQARVQVLHSMPPAAKADVLGRRTASYQEQASRA